MKPTPPPISAAVAAFLDRPGRMLIGDEWIGSDLAGSIEVLDPATGGRIGYAAAGTSEHVDKAVDAARACFESSAWKRTTPSQRTALLWRLSELIEQNGDELAELETLNEGLPINLVKSFIIPGLIETLRYYAGWATRMDGAAKTLSIPDERPDGAFGPAYHAYTRMQPVGVVGAIVPWNNPLIFAVAKFAPAIAAGCTMVLKPADETPFSTLRFAELVLEAGFPAGVLNVVTGRGSVVGAALAAHPGVNKIAFTGSTETGKSIVSAATGNLKRVSLELGGKSPVIVLDDADLKSAIQGVCETIFLNSGQICFAGSRVIAQSGIFEDLMRGVADVARSMKLGHGLLPDTDLGPLISARQQARVCGYIQSGISDGARLLCGGPKPSEQGFFVEPTVMIASDPTIRIVQEEVFGPVLVGTEANTLGEIIRLANDTPYGLAASVWTKDLSIAHGLAAEIDAGTVWVNCHNALDEAMPFGGFKQSGWGREGSQAGVAEFMEEKSVIVRL